MFAWERTTSSAPAASMMRYWGSSGCRVATGPASRTGKGGQAGAFTKTKAAGRTPSGCASPSTSAQPPSVTERWSPFTRHRGSRWTASSRRGPRPGGDGRGAIANGGQWEGEPGLRPQYNADFYAAYVRDPDGNKLVAVCRSSPANRS